MTGATTKNEFLETSLKIVGNVNYLFGFTLINYFCKKNLPFIHNQMTLIIKINQN